MHHKKTNQSSIELIADTNNNKKIEKYSLRQRYKRQCSRTKQSASSALGLTTKIPSIDNSTRTSNEHSSSSIAQHSTSSTIIGSSSSDTNNRNKSTKQIKQKPKPKAAPLSKYRRKTANARERTRMREINSAFENLRKCVPLSISDGTPTPTNNEKLTKITTLRLAMKYIRTLSEVLKSPIGEHSFVLTEQTNNNNNDSNFMLSSNNNSSSNSSYSSISNSNSNSNEIFSDLFLSASHDINSNNINDKQIHISTDIQKCSKQMINNKKLLNIPPCLSSSSIDTDLGLILESDGESLHLSEPCLSPLSHNMKAFSCSTTSALELGILLESDTDSLQLSEPCLSPLGGLDSLNPFGDLLHTGFSEQTNLDLYLT